MARNLTIKVYRNGELVSTETFDRDIIKIVSTRR